MTLDQRNFLFLKFTTEDTKCMKCLSLVCNSVLVVLWVPWQAYQGSLREMQLWLSGHTSTWRKGVTTSACTKLAAWEEIFFFKKVLHVDPMYLWLWLNKLWAVGSWQSRACFSYLQGFHVGHVLIWQKQCPILCRDSAPWTLAGAWGADEKG